MPGTIKNGQKWAGAKINGNAVAGLVKNGGVFYRAIPPVGVNWESVNSGYNSTAWQSICRGNGLFVAVSNGTPRCMTSPNGITWTNRTITAQAWKRVRYGNGLFVALAPGDGANYLSTSSNGTSWTARSVPNTDSLGSNITWNDITWGANQFVMVGYNANNYNIATSPDCINWTLRQSSRNGFYSVIYADDKYVAIHSPPGNLTATQTVAVSPDGIAWTSQGTTYVGAGNMAYGKNMIVCTAGGYNAMTRPCTLWSSRNNYIQWYGRNQADQSWFGVAFGADLFVTVGSTAGAKVMTSPDGIVWTIRNGVEEGNWNDVCYAPDLNMFAAVANSGTVRVMISK